MSLVVRSLHRPEKPELLNEEWIVLENTGPGVLASGGWTIEVGNRGFRPHPLGTLQPGFVMQPGEKVRLITGTASKKAQGTPAVEEGMKNYHLFLREPVLKKAGLVVQVKLKQLTLATVTFDPDAENGIAPVAATKA
ncbi:MAG: hypothetical protein EXR72_02845 [Myxococcales bacterium]|nr:hypothetical protein [Myxococcales bacterium]